MTILSSCQDRYIICTQYYFRHPRTEGKSESCQIEMSHSLLNLVTKLVFRLSFPFQLEPVTFYASISPRLSRWEVDRVNPVSLWKILSEDGTQLCYM